MHEKPEIEQFFFDEPTLNRLARLAVRFSNPCCLCTPSLGQELEKGGVSCRTLDVDARFSHLRGFRPYDLGEPEPLGERFGVIICDPPFLTITLQQLFHAVEILSLGNYAQPLLINCLSSRAPLITRIFTPFGLKSTGYGPGYEKIQNSGRNRMEFFGNLGPEYPLMDAVPTL